MCSVCERWAEKGATATVAASDGPVAQPGRALAWHARSRRFESDRVHFAPFEAYRALGFTLGGLVAGEASFVICRRGTDFIATGTPRLRFVFVMTMASRDRPLLEQLETFLGAGSIVDTPARKAHWQPTSTFSVSSIQAHWAATIPFADQFLLPCAKRRQFEAWRQTLGAYDRDRPRRVRSICSVEGCGKPVRGRGLCRSHYYRVTGY